MSIKKYSKEDLEKAIKDINNGVLTIYRASQVYKIPNQTLHDKINRKYIKQENAGAPSVLTTQEEQLLVEWVLQMAEIGFPVTRDQLLQSVAKLVLELKRPNQFKNGVPGRHWYEAFLRRNTIISKRVCQSLTTARVNADEEKIKGWFGRVRKYFDDNHHLEVLEDPSRIFNVDESAFFLNPKGQPVLARKGVKNVHCRSGNDDKENLTLSLGASAEGKLMPVLALFPYKRLPQNILLKYPKEWTIGRTDSGWMTCESFYEYVANQFEPFLTRENIKRPVALFLDGHVSHLSLPLCEFCKEKEIILIALLPNATHALQPMDVAVFHSLKNAWSKEVYTWRMENNGSRLKRDDFGPVLEKAIKKTLRPEIIQNGFRKSGLFPFDENAVDYKKLPKSSTASTSSGTSTPVSLVSAESCKSSSQHMKWFEMNLDPHKLIEFLECSGEWTGNVKDDSLYYFWKQLRQTCTSTTPSSIALGNSTLEANDFTLADLDLDWVNDDTIVESALLNEVTLSGALPCSTPKTSNLNKIKRVRETKEASESLIVTTTSSVKTVTNAANSETTEPSPSKTKTITDPQTPQISDTLEKYNTSDVTTIIVPPVQTTFLVKTVTNAANAESIEPSLSTTKTVTDPQTPQASDTLVMHNTSDLTTIMVPPVQITPPIDRVTHNKLIKSSDLLPTDNSNSTTTSALSQKEFLKLAESENKLENSLIPEPQPNGEEVTKKGKFPTPFKNALLWPETPSTKGKKLVKKKLAPTVGTSDEYIEYARRLENDKKEKLRVKEVRKQERETKIKEKKMELKNKSIQKEMTKKGKATKKNRVSAEEDDSNMSSEVPDLVNEPGPSGLASKYNINTTYKNRKNEVPSIISENITNTDPMTIALGDYVVIMYEGQKFPGLVLKVIDEASGRKYEVKTMTMSFANGRVNWRWPEKDDILIYDVADVLKKINDPISVNRRGVYSIQDFESEDED